jgi:hypothetical protein
MSEPSATIATKIPFHKPIWQLMKHEKTEVFKKRTQVRDFARTAKLSAHERPYYISNDRYEFIY